MRVLFCQALASGFRTHPTPQPPTALTRDVLTNLARGGAAPDDPLITPEGQRGSKRSVNRCAAGKAHRPKPRGIDPGFIYLESGKPLLDAGRRLGSPLSLNCRGATLIRRRLCGSNSLGLSIQSDDQFLTQNSGKTNPLLLGLLLLPLEGGGREGVSGPGKLVSAVQITPILPDLVPAP